MPLRAPGPNPILLSPVQPSAAVRAWYARRLDAQITSMHQHVQGAIQSLWEMNQPVHVATFPAHVLGGLLDRLEAHYVEQFNLRASEVVHGFLHRCLDHVDFAFGASLRKAGFQVAARGPLTYDALAMDDFSEELHPRDEHGKFTTGFGNAELSTRVPSNMVKKERFKDDPEHDTRLSDYQALKEAVAGVKSQPSPLAKVAELVKDTPGLKLDGTETPEQIAEKYIEHGVRNLLYLHDSMAAEDRDRAKLWYDGANAVTSSMAESHDLSHPQAAAITAVLSPQKDWFQNVSLAERTMDIMRDQQGTKWDEHMSEWIKDRNGYIGDAAEKQLKDVVGKTLGELKNADEKAMWIRAYDETHNSRSYKELSPEGRVLGNAVLVDEDGDVVHNPDGSTREGKCAWGTLDALAKAVSIYEDGSATMISHALGDKHKVRNFYDNIISPNSKNGHCTIDTHAVAAIQMMPYGGTSLTVRQNFGAGFSNDSSGLSGTYALNHECYVRAAKERNLLPREMQSITWERVRSLFSAEFKRSDEDQADKKDKETSKVTKGREGNHTVRNIWAQVKSGEISQEEAQEKIAGASHVYTTPAWVGRTSTEAIGHPTYEKVVANPGIPVRPAAGAKRRVGDGDAKFNPAPRIQGLSNVQRLFFQRIGSVTMDATTMPPKVPFIKRKDLWGHLALKFEMTPSMRRALAERLDDNVGLISTKPNKGGTISRQYFGLIRDRVYKSINKGRDLTGLTEDLHEALGITRRRAGLIARDQNNKATSLFVRTRQKEIGINKAQWMHTAASIHPRLEHEGWDSMPYLVDEGMQSMEEGEQQWPGSAINCGCLSMPIIPGYNDEGDEYSTLKDDEEEAG
jgi:hypothetical protein